MGPEPSIADVLERWLSENEHRIAGRFEVERVTDWTKAEEHGLALDIFGSDAAGRITVWPNKLLTAGHAVCDCDIVADADSRVLFKLSYGRFSREIVDTWFDALVGFNAVGKPG